MKIVPTPIAGMSVVETTTFRDHRGSFRRVFCEDELAPLLAGRHIVQMNLSRTVNVGAVRGMHFQKSPHAEMKLIRCIKGRVWDVGVDLRSGSPTFLRWHAEVLTPENALMLVVPEGCAHGFQALEPGSELLYLHTSPYTASAEGGVAHDDARLGIAWPLPPTDLSDRDRAYPSLASDYPGLPA